jgi:hypothetical protein
MQTLGTFLLPPQSHLYRIVRKYCAVFIVPLPQSDTAAFQQINRGQ